MQQFLVGNASQHLLSEELGHRLHLSGNGGIVLIQIGVVSSGVDDAQVVSLSGQIKVDLFNDRLCKVENILPQCSHFRVDGDFQHIIIGRGLYHGANLQIGGLVNVSGNPAAQLWRKVMQPLHDGLEYKAFTYPYIGENTGIFGIQDTVYPSNDFDSDTSTGWGTGTNDNNNTIIAPWDDGSTWGNTGNDDLWGNNSGWGSNDWGSTGGTQYLG